MRRPPSTGISATADQSRSIELWVAALLRRPDEPGPRTEDAPREAPHTTTHRRHQARQWGMGCGPSIIRPSEAPCLGSKEDTMGYTHTNSKGETYGLHSRTTESSTGRPRTLYYFSKTVEGAIDELPQGYRVVEARTGLPLLKRTG